jgi:uncharacterized phage infection (PIP) family protein YhgE
MSTSGAPHARKLSLSLDKLPDSASTLNSASHRLNQAIEQLNTALKSLNLGIAVWTRTWAHEEDSVSDVEEIGYARVRGKWGISIRKTIEFDAGPEPEEREWHFSDAPRDMRIRAIDYLPQLMEQLNTGAAETAKKLAERADDAEQLALVITVMAEEKKKVVTRAKLLTESERGK